MKTSFHHSIILSFLSAVALIMTSCWTSIWTLAPTTEYEAPVKTSYTTQVTTPSPRTTTTTTITVTTFNNDWSFYLDLQAVAAAFAEASSVQEFERILNSSRYMINNLDLNRDGWVDYLRVIETYQGYHHVFLIQACLAPAVFQDVATLVAEWRHDRLYVEVIGDRYLYGYNYVVRPVFVKRPPMWDLFGRPTYNPWTSPYYHGHWPSYYQQPKPVYLNHYQAYVNTYMHNHHYCHQCDYPSKPYWDGYTTMTQSNRRNDYEVLHPDNSFERRVSQPAGRSGMTVHNAAQLRAETTQASQRVSENNGGSARTSTNTSTNTTRTSGSTNTSTNTTRTSGSTTTTRSSATQPQSTSVSTRVSKSGETRTTIKQTDAAGKTTTVQRTSSNATTRQSTNTSRQSTNTSRQSTTTTRQSGTTTRQSESSRVSGNAK